MGERILPVSVRPQLKDIGVRSEPAERAGDDGVKRGVPDPVVRVRIERDIDRHSFSIACSYLPGHTGARKERATVDREFAGLVKGDREDAPVLVKAVLDAVAVVGIDVYVRNPVT